MSSNSQVTEILTPKSACSPQKISRTQDDVTMIISFKELPVLQHSDHLTPDPLSNACASQTCLFLGTVVYALDLTSANIDTTGRLCI
jgi:hypothetical protein